MSSGKQKGASEHDGNWRRGLKGREGVKNPIWRDSKGEEPWEKTIQRKQGRQEIGHGEMMSVYENNKTIYFVCCLLKINTKIELADWLQERQMLVPSVYTLFSCSWCISSVVGVVGRFSLHPALSQELGWMEGQSSEHCGWVTMQKKGGMARRPPISNEMAVISRPLQLIVYWPPLVPRLCLSQGTKKHASQVLGLTQAVEAAEDQGSLLPRALYFLISWHHCQEYPMRYFFTDSACYESR